MAIKLKITLHPEIIKCNTYSVVIAMNTEYGTRINPLKIPGVFPKQTGASSS